MRNNIILVGFMGTGKTVVGKMVAAKLGYTYIDTDDIIEQMAQKRIPDIFAEEGEPRFREYEREAIKKLVTLERYVVSTGGGAVIFDENINRMKSAGLVVCLSARPEVIYERIKENSYRPLLQVSNPLQKIRELLTTRQQQYEKADILVDTSDLTIAEVVESLIATIGSHAFPTNT